MQTTQSPETMSREELMQAIATTPSLIELTHMQAVALRRFGAAAFEAEEPVEVRLVYGGYQRSRSRGAR